MLVKGIINIMKKGTHPVKSGLSFGEQIRTVSTADAHDFILIKFLIALAGTFGVIMTLVSSFSLPVDSVSLFFKTALFLGIFAFAAWKKKLAKFILPAFFLLLIIFFLCEADEVILGFQKTYNAIVRFAEEFYTNTPAKFTIEREFSTVMDSHVNTMFGYATAILGFIISLGIIYSPNLFPVLTVTLPALTLELFIGLEPSAWAFILVLCCWISVLTMQISSYKVRVKNNSSEFIRERKHSNTFYPTHNFKNSVVSVVGIIAAAVTLFSYLGVEFYLDRNDLNDYEKIDGARMDALKKIQEISVEEIINGLTPDMGQSVPLGTVDERKFKNVTDLKVTLPYAGHTVYLKGYVGGTYKNNSWSAIPDELYQKYSDMFKDFTEDDFIPQNMGYEFYSLAAPFNNPHNVTVENVRADKRYVYAPYFTDYSVGNHIKYVKDAYVSSKQKDEYTFPHYYNKKQTDILNMAYNGIDSSNGFLQNKISNFSDREKQYRQFVYEAYTALPDDKFDEIKSQFASMKNSSDWVFKLYSIKNRLSEYTYTLAPGKTPAGKDFVEYFLYENKQGYCTYFASAGVIMLRAAGVPARYVEGYVVRPEDFSWKDGQPETIEIKDKASHAWVEIYVDGAGWIPFEMTPSSTLPEEEPEETTAEETTAPPIAEETTAPPESATEPSVTTVITENPNQSQQTDIVSVPDLDGEIPPEKKEPVSYKWLLWVGIIALILSAVILRRLIVIRRRDRSFRSKNTNLNIRHMYSYLEALLKFIGMSNTDSLPYLEYADYIEEHLTEYHFDANFKTVMKISLAAGFGENTLSEKEEQLMHHFTTALCGKIYSELSAIQKLWFMFGLNLK